MQNVTVTSTTDSAEAVIAAQGGTASADVKVEETNPAAAETPAETLEASEALETSDTDEEDSSDDSKEPKKTKGMVKRIGKLTKQREDARREVEYWKQEALKLKPAESKPVEAATKADAQGKPTAETFGTHEEYVEALADWKVEQKLSAREAQTKQAELKNEETKRLNSYIQKRDEFAKGHDDYFERMEDIKEIPMSLTVNESLLESENGPELLYALAADPAEYKRICALPAIAAARELGKFEAKLAKDSSETKPTEAKTTKAPKPIAPVGNSGNVATKKLEDMDFEDFKRARMAGRTT